MVLDMKRLNKQIIECKQILNAISGLSNAWRNHPAVIQYRKHTDWLNAYMQCLIHYKKHIMHDTSEDHIGKARIWNLFALNTTPDFHKISYFDQMKRRLYTKDNNYYKQWSYLGESQENWYWSDVENDFIKYINGKRIK